MFALPKFQLGKPIRHQSLSVFPLFAEPGEQIDYILSDEAMKASAVTVEEVSEAGSVPELLVTNHGERRVLFLEGEHLIGAKQNRVLNTSVLVAAKSRIKIPVSCVEQGRWRSDSRHFASGGTHVPSAIRSTLKRSVSESLTRGGGHHSDQGQVWKDVAMAQTSLGIESHTMALSDSFGGYQERIEDFMKGLPMPDQAIGLAVGIGDRVVAVEFFNKTETLRKVWNRLLTGFVLESLSNVEPSAVDAESIEQFLEKVRASRWEPAKAVGEGEDYRSNSEDALASALTVGGTVVHGSALTQS